MEQQKQRQLDELLLHGLESLDLSEAQFNDAVAKYEAVGRCLAAPGSVLTLYSPTIYAQGSMAIGTTNKPVGRDERDIDLVCEMNLPATISQAEAKRLLGQCLMENTTYAKMLQEKNRCWRLIYAGEFHMDILPSKPDHRLPTPTALLVPDSALQSWKESDPKGYAAWFGREAARSMRQLSGGIRAGVEPAPQYLSVWDKAPLQIAIQLLKRHRDIRLNGNDDAPISIIITTLAARAYRGQDSIVATLFDLLQRMPLYIDHDENRLPFVTNPTNVLENFADKWHKEPQKQQVFNQWIECAKADLNKLAVATLGRSGESLIPFLGERHANDALRAYGDRMQQQRRSGLRVATASGLLGATAGRTSEVVANTFYGASELKGGRR